MLPLLQSHPPTVPNTSLDTNFDRVVDPIYAQPSTEDQLFHDIVPSPDRRFPIRTVQSHTRSLEHGAYGLRPSHRAQEHQLRRKTPNGTIDAGYDGSCVRQPIGEPPLKQLAVPSHPGNLLDYHALPAQPAHSRTLMDASGFHVPSAAWQVSGYAGQLPQSYNVPSDLYHAGQQLAPPFASVYQPVLRANEYNVRAFCPPPPTLVGGLSFGQLGFQQGLPIWDYHSSQDANAVPRSGVYQSLPPVNYAANALGSHLSSSHISNYAVPHIKSQFSNAYTLDNGMFNSHPDFKEKALSQGYRCYASIVAYMQASARVSATKDSTGGDSTSSKHLIFPKPPRPKRESYGSTTASQQTGAASSRFSVTPFPANDLFSISYRNSRYMHAPAQGEHIIFAGVDQFRAPQSIAGGPHSMPDSTMNMPNPNGYSTNDVISSIDILKSLCEQSQWMWLEGILVLGCLQYALEQYSDALHCFSRITVLDARYEMQLS